MLKSPSLHMSLDNLKAIKLDNYIGRNGTEYCPFEVNNLIWEKENKAAALYAADKLRSQVREPDTTAQPTTSRRRFTLDRGPIELEESNRIAWKYKMLTKGLILSAD